MEVKNQVLMLGKGVAAEVSPEHGPHRVWLWLGPRDRGRLHRGGPHRGEVELCRVQQLRGVDPEEWPRPGQDPEVVEREYFPDLDAAIAVLVDRGVDTDAFDAVWKSSNPF